MARDRRASARTATHPTVIAACQPRHPRRPPGDVGRQCEIDDAAGPMKLRGQQPKGTLRFGSSFNSDVAITRAEVDAEMLGVEGSPGAMRIYLGCGGRGENREKKQRAACGVRRNHRAISRKKFSMPFATPRAYRSRPSALASIASCSGIIMNKPSVSADGIQGSRTS